MRQVQCPVLVGRDDEARHIDAALAAAAAGTGCRKARSSTRTAWFVLTHLLGRANVRVCDGSWAEWGRLPGTPVDTA